MKRIKDKRKRNQHEDSPLNKYEECIKACKDDALKKCDQLAKKDIVSDIVAEFILANLNRIRPVPSLFRSCMDGERISMNTILDSVGGNGIIIGAMAYRIGEQLEIELPGNELQHQHQSVVTYINGKEAPEINSDDVPISATYFKYFIKHHDSMFLQNGYLYELIRDNTDKYNESLRRTSEIFLFMQVMNTNHEIKQFSHFCLRRMVFNEFSGDEIDLLYNMKDEYQELLEEHINMENEGDHKDLILALASVSMALEQLEEIQDAT